jgi:hypothetical protein
MRVGYRRPASAEPVIRWADADVAAVVTAALSKVSDRAYAIELFGALEDLKRVAGDATVFEVDT